MGVKRSRTLSKLVRYNIEMLHTVQECGAVPNMVRGDLYSVSKCKLGKQREALTTVIPINRT